MVRINVSILMASLLGIILLVSATDAAKKVDKGADPVAMNVLSEAVTAEGQQEMGDQAKSVGQPHRIKLQKPKSLKTITEYEMCKQECKRKRDQESMGEYVQWLQNELKFAEEQIRTQQQNVDGQE